MTTRLLCALGLVACLACAQTLASQQNLPEQRSVTRGDAAKTSQPNKDAEANPTQPVPPITVVVQEQPKDEKAETERREREIRIQQRIANLTGALVAVSFLTGCVVAWQAYETRRSVNAAKESAKTTATHFAILNEQWLDASFVRAHAVGKLTIITKKADGTVKTRDEQKNQWLIRFKITNNTPLPVRIETLEILVEGNTTIVHIPRTITPNSEFRPKIEATAIAGPTIEALNKSGMKWVNVYGCITYTNAQKQRVNQCFGRGGWVSKWNEDCRLKEVIAGADSEEKFRAIRISESVVRAKVDQDSSKA